MYLTDICRTLTLDYIGEVTNHGVSSYRFAGTDRLFANATDNTDNCAFVRGAFAIRRGESRSWHADQLSLASACLRFSVLLRLILPWSCSCNGLICPYHPTPFNCKNNHRFFRNGKKATTFCIKKEVVMTNWTLKFNIFFLLIFSRCISNQYFKF